MRRGALLAVLLACAACPVTPLPGNEPMGSWAMTATDPAVACELAAFTSDGGEAGFSFSATLTRDSDSTAAWLTLEGYSREATFDGQIFSSVGEASRVFNECRDCTTKLVETFTVAVLSRSQSDALAGACPSNPLDGGVPAPDDAGITGPRQTDQGFDAVRLCGVLATEVVALGTSDGGACEAKCGACSARYQLRGDRR